MYMRRGYVVLLSDHSTLTQNEKVFCRDDKTNSMIPRGLSHQVTCIGAEERGGVMP